MAEDAVHIAHNPEDIQSHVSFYRESSLATTLADLADSPPGCKPAYPYSTLIR